MSTKRMYIFTVIEIAVFLFIGFFLSQYGMSKIYKAMGIAYLGNVGVIWFALSFLLFCLYTIFRIFALSQKTYLLKNRISSATFWIVFTYSVYALLSPFVRGKI